MSFLFLSLVVEALLHFAFQDQLTMINTIPPFQDFISLFYPNLCVACDRNTPVHGGVICLPCQYHLPKTKFHLDRENPFTDRFWGRVPINAGAALYYFTKGGRTQKLIHKLKYNGKVSVGIKLGNLYGRMLKQSPYFSQIDLIVPVPLHPKKRQKRGYNQSDLFARGLSDEMQISNAPYALKRLEMTETQTRKSQAERFANVAAAFAVNQPKILKGKHVLLVDDVMTTGATMEACANQILSCEGTRVSMATIAFTEY